MAMSFNLLALTRNYSNKAISSDRTNSAGSTVDN